MDESKRTESRVVFIPRKMGAILTKIHPTFPHTRRAIGKALVLSGRGWARAFAT